VTSARLLFAAHFHLSSPIEPGMSMFRSEQHPEKAHASIAKSCEGASKRSFLRERQSMKQAVCSVRTEEGICSDSSATHDVNALEAIRDSVDGEANPKSERVLQ
jgi:hypothetical protein